MMVFYGFMVLFNMEAKLLKIKLQPDSRPHLEHLITYMREHIEYPRNEMAQKRYFWDSVFFEQTKEAEFIYIVIKSEDFFQHNGR
ncbi:DUF6176 family protein [Shewanella violacea]|uniref:Uncharacterized protein n=1 Tax=Shewanella violacea (strain JCM 10179 / CIP 106290 / LMG 19151 / DSS12) TaxID=637905 RepID=D4ZEB7_SHEVD|nr:DUF6176 family protein [Shewanella violacea]BAJ04178.1 hypothetical protein SVI_4207 [Shewanella violacea DSS12]